MAMHCLANRGCSELVLRSDVPLTSSCASSIKSSHTVYRLPRFTKVCNATTTPPIVHRAVTFASLAAIMVFTPKLCHRCGVAGSRKRKHRGSGVKQFHTLSSYSSLLGSRPSECGGATSCHATQGKESSTSTEPEKSIEEKFNDFTRALPWFDMAATILALHAKRRKGVQDKAHAQEFPTKLMDITNPQLSAALLDAIAERNDAASFPCLVEAALRASECDPSRAGQPCSVVDAICGRWEVVWSAPLTPLQHWGLPRQSIWVSVDRPEPAGSPAVVTAHSGLPLIFFGAYLWTSCAGELVEGDLPEDGGARPIVLRFNRFWIDFGREPRGDIGRIDGGLITSRLKAWAALVVTPVLFELGWLKWFLDRIGMIRTFEVDLPSAEPGGKTMKLEASLELYLTLFAMVAFPETLSTCPVPFLDPEAGVCIFEIPVLGPLGDLPKWLHPGGNSAAFVARRLADGQHPALIR